MKVIGITEQEQHNVFSVLASILWLGNVDFRDGGDKSSPIDTDCTYPPKKYQNKEHKKQTKITKI